MSKLSECKKIYEQAFGNDDKDFENLLFEKCFKYVKTADENGEVCAMLFALPCSLESKNGSFDAVYIYAAATRADKRGRGYMTALINGITKEEKSVVFLRPANEGLIVFYERLGFVTVKAQKSQKVLPEILPLGEFAVLTEALAIKADNTCYNAMYHNLSPVKFDNINFIFTME